jgi:hypothetical protein
MSEPTWFWRPLDIAAIAQSHIGDEAPVSRLNTKNRPPVMKGQDLFNH